MIVELTFPRVGRKRLTVTSALSATATTLWIGAPAVLPFAVVTPMHVTEGVALPLAVGWVTLLLMERRIARDLVRIRREILPEQADAAELAGRRR